jgi:hypothetical protein
MKIVIINGTNHQGSTYHITHQLLNKLDGDIKEFFLPKDFDDFCLGCTNCFKKDENLCPHRNKLKPIEEALIEADLIVLESPVYVYQFDVTENGLAEIEKFIKEKIADIEANENTPDSELKGCTPDERWSKGDTWAIMKTGRKTALKVCKTEEEAKSLLAELGGTNIEFRKGEDVRCSSYCNVCEWCPYYQKQKVDNK